MSFVRAQLTNSLSSKRTKRNEDKHRLGPHSMCRVSRFDVPPARLRRTQIMFILSAVGTLQIFVSAKRLRGLFMRRSNNAEWKFPSSRGPTAICSRLVPAEVRTRRMSL
ncbi:hypothetical protein EVAR_61877_1 [Eumeta japonica]|uniref:Uncharacterized protein n=1 Tax=Eumeta variegata TaxID=151549 RepID=A0A4C1YVJ7_EUMVA|nr:hypothetical protein EVAR_61877_1 [Eumeta japonica]